MPPYYLLFYTLKQPLFIISFVLFCSNQILIRIGVSVALMRNYIDDFLCMLIVFTMALGVLRFYLGSSTYKLSRGQIVFGLVYFSIWFEGIAPRFYPMSFTADIVDVGCYIMGTLIFMHGINHPLFFKKTSD